MWKTNSTSEEIHHSIEKLEMDAAPGVFCGFMYDDNGRVNKNTVSRPSPGSG